MPLNGIDCSFLDGWATTTAAAAAAVVVVVAVTGTIRVVIPCVAPPFCAAALTSSSVTLPCGPPPFRVEISTLSSLARRRVAGGARTLAPRDSERNAGGAPRCALVVSPGGVGGGGGGRAGPFSPSSQMTRSV